MYRVIVTPDKSTKQRRNGKRKPHDEEAEQPQEFGFAPHYHRITHLDPNVVDEFEDIMRDIETRQKEDTIYSMVKGDTPTQPDYEASFFAKYVFKPFNRVYRALQKQDA